MHEQPTSVNGLVTPTKAVTKQLGNGRWIAQCIVTKRVGNNTVNIWVDVPGEFGDEVQAAIAAHSEGRKKFGE